jgi:MFS family permease
VIEAYDFLLYGLVAPLALGKLYFPASDPLVGTLQAFGIYAVGFLSRPVGAAIFGHYGDRIGRKATLITTLLLTGLSTFAVGFVPGYAAIGIWGAVILTLLRLIQGIGVGGEWGGAVLLSMEWARTNRSRGLVASWPQWGGPFGLFLAEQNRIERAPVIEVTKRQPKEIILTALLRTGQQGPFYIFTAFVFSYGTTVSHSSRNLSLTALLVATAISAVTIPLFGHV